MKVTDVAVYAGKPEGTEELFTFSLSRSDPTAQYMAREMLGMDVEELIPKFYGFSLQSKAKFYDFVMRPRTIVTRIVLNPRFNLDESYSDIRDNLYRSISAVRSGVVVMHFNSIGTTVARIFGFITRFEVPYFTPLPEVSITIRCDDPMFRAINPVIYEPEDLPSANPLILSDNTSTAPHGFQFEITFTGTAPSFTIQDQLTNPEWLFKVIPNGGFQTGDKLFFSSDYSNKYLYMERASVRTYLVDKIQPESIWPLLFPGHTSLYFLEMAVFDWNNLEYFSAYWGV
jgi:hypothetical protein